MPPMANKNLDKCVLLLRQMMDRDSGSASSSGGKKLGLKKKSKRVSVLTTAARPKVKKKDSKVVTTRKVFSKTKLNVDAAKKPRSKLTSAPQTIAKDACEVEDLSHRPERDFQSGKVSQLPDKLPEHISDGPIQPKSAIHFDKPFTALQPPRHCSQPLDGSTAPSLSRPASQSDTMQQSGIAPPFNQRLLSSTPAMTPVKVTRPASAEVTGGDPLPLNSSDQVRAVRPPSPPPIIPRLLEGVIAFQPQPCGNMSPGMTTSSRIEPLPPFVGVTSQYMVSSAGQELVQPCEATVYDQRTVAATNLVTAAWMDDYPVRDSTTTGGLRPSSTETTLRVPSSQWSPRDISRTVISVNAWSETVLPCPIMSWSNGTAASSTGTGSDCTELF
ncbi:hypothetical protein NP493_186g00011 [Ridgeia piscesae]|uniref:Uncharacterized protein n=1 Tax=Ridgeia piscesae TaxID=27915 RepID=A0AAD9P2C1_RIDPI|nr:hypothetical protein NP493_186g00011 [Ridgeia piscesae]